jgi:YD repeat-containing protein
MAAKCLQLPVFIFSDYSMKVGKKELSQTVATEFTDYGQIVNTTDYEYNSNTLVSKITRGDSKGETKITTFAYPTDFASTQPYTKMVENNIIAPVIEESTYKNAVLTGNHLQSNKTEYVFWSNGQATATPNNSIYPKAVWSRTTSNNYEERLQYRSYDSDGNITSVGKANDIAKSYIWGYNNLYPVAEFVGVSYSNAFSLLDQSIIQNPISDDALRTELNKIRINYPAAQITTYTYKPLVGMTSSTDANGRTTYYQYDAAGRLQLVKDKDGNVVKTFEYKYRQ